MLEKVLVELFVRSVKNCEMRNPKNSILHLNIIVIKIQKFLKSHEFFFNDGRFILDTFHHFCRRKTGAVSSLAMRFGVQQFYVVQFIVQYLATTVTAIFV